MDARIGDLRLNEVEYLSQGSEDRFQEGTSKLNDLRSSP